MKKVVLFLCLFALVLTGYFLFTNKFPVQNHAIGSALDSLNHVKVYYNGSVSNVHRRNTKDGYNLGLEFQCVEFVKRYYYEHYKHKMPDSYGHAVSFFNKELKDGQTNKQRALTQYRNPSSTKPQVGDLIILDGTSSNEYGHVAIISNVGENSIEIIQQNPGMFASSRVNFDLTHKKNGKWYIEKERILGWLRK